MAGRFRIERLGDHDRSAFDCGASALNTYLRERASQDVRRRLAVCHVAIEGSAGRLAGFYTLSAADVPLTGLPEALAKRMPRYPALPVARIGRLAVDQDFQGAKLGAALLADAVLRVSAADIAAFAIVVDAKDDRAARFYRHHGFIAYDSAPNTMILALAALKASK